MSNRHRILHMNQPIFDLQTIRDQKAYLNRMTIHGVPTQAATDLLNKLYCDLLLMQRRRARLGS